ncbi:hypothetical protein BRAS3843_640009 [Bradyrhizobium sp. STM 3843]|nr:hypothetical protein BRAS3843_640009 [Bradyrhizobium sp. STM 3843]
MLAGTMRAVHRRLTQTLRNDTTFAVGVICLGLSQVAMIAIVLFLRDCPSYALSRARPASAAVLVNH